MTKTLRCRGTQALTGARAIADVLSGTPEAFTMGSMRGDTGYTTHTGRLPDDWRRTYHARSFLVTFTIYSYATPIAWLDTEVGWVVPAVSYSPTTGKHQSMVRGGIHLNHTDYLD